MIGRPPGSENDVDMNHAEQDRDWVMSDCRLKEELLNELLANLNLLIDHDACCRSDGANRFCASYSCPDRSFLCFDAAGHCVLLHPPNVTALACSLIKHYFDCKQAAPSTTSALMVLP